MEKDAKINFFKKQHELEQKIIDAAEKAVQDVDNVLVKELILAIALDSKKHASMLAALIAKNSEVQPFVQESKMDLLAKNIDHHIKLEAQAIETYKQLLDNLEDDQEKLVINAVYRDELRHHALLKRIHKVIVEKETITADEMWDFMMEDATPNY